MQLPRLEVVAPLVLFALICSFLVFDRYRPGSLLSAVTYTTGVTGVDAAAVSAGARAGGSPFQGREATRTAAHTVLATVDHDSSCFTQGLLYHEGCVAMAVMAAVAVAALVCCAAFPDHNFYHASCPSRYLYESCGLNGHSSVRKVDPDTGKVRPQLPPLPTMLPFPGPLPHPPPHPPTPLPLGRSLTHTPPPGPLPHLTSRQGAARMPDTLATALPHLTISRLAVSCHVPSAGAARDED